MKQTRKKAIIALVTVLAILLGLCRNVGATEIYNESDVIVNSDSYIYRQVYLAEGDGMAVFFRINNGDGVTFFIVDSFGHGEIQAGRAAPTGYNQSDCPRNNGVWWWVRFVAPDTDYWYVYFSKDYGTAYNTGQAAELDIIIRTETEGPSIVIISSIPDVVRGDIAISFNVSDDCFGIDRVEVRVDGVLAETIPGNRGSNFFESRFTFSSYDWLNGNHTISFKAYDTYGHEGTPYEVQVDVQNGFFDNPWNVLLVVLLVALVCVLALICCLLKR